MNLADPRRFRLLRAIAWFTRHSGFLAVAGDVSQRITDVAALDKTLIALSKLDPRKSELVELRFFGGLTAEETAEVLAVSVRTVHCDWDLARAWLFHELRGPE